MTIDASRLTVELVSVDDIDTVVATFPHAIARSWQEPFSEPGNGTAVLKSADADLALYERGGRQLLYYLLDGERVFGIVLEDYENVAVSRAEEKAQNRSLIGPGLLALTRRARVYPPVGVDRRPIVEDRSFSWPAPEYDASAWGAASTVCDIATAKVSWLIPWDTEFPDDTAEVVWDADGTVTASIPGELFLRWENVTTGDGPHILFAGSDNYAEAFVESQLSGTPGVGDASYLSGFTRTTQTALDLSAGSHVIAMHVVNVPFTPGNNSTLEVGNPAGAVWALYTVDAAGGLGTLVAHSTAADAVMLARPATPPGMTPGQALKIALDEAQARGCFPYLGYDFDEELDSAGEPWPIVGDIATKVGTDVLTFIRELAGTYIDVRMGLDLTLHAYIKGTYGEPLAVELHPALDPTDPTSGNLAELSHKGEAVPVNAALIRTALGWHERTRDASIAAYERIETEVGLGALSTVVEAYRVTDGIFDAHAAPREEVNATVASGGPIPYLDYDLADAITVPDSDGVPVVRPVVTITVDHSAGSDSVDVAPTLGDVILPPDARAMQAVKKMIEGTGGGRFKEAQPVPPIFQPRARAAPAGLPSFTETFDKADGALGPDLTWAVLPTFFDPGGCEVIGNKAGHAAGEARASKVSPGLGFVDMSVSADVTLDPGTPAPDTGVGGFLCARAGSPGGVGGDRWYGFGFGLAIDGSPLTCNLVKLWAGGLDNIATSVGPVAVDGTRITIEVIGTSIRGLVDGVEIMSATDSTIATGDTAGFVIGVFAPTADVGQFARLDNFTIQAG